MELERVGTLIAGRFGRAEPRQRALDYLRGLLAPLERKNGWTLAEHAGAVSPDSTQRLVRTTSWSADEVRDDLRGYVVAELGAADGILTVDESGFIKKGVQSAGVARQYTSTTGKIDNCQVGVFLSYLTPPGDRTLMDRELYLPKTWTEDRARCQAAGIGDEVEFATKPELARRMIERAVAAQVPFAWVTADEAYGQNRALRRWLEHHRLPYVMATRRDDLLLLGGDRRRQARILAGQVHPDCWERRSAGDGAHGQRLYDWAWVGLATPAVPGWSAWLLIRRSIDDGQLAFHVCAGPATTTLPELIVVAGARWGIEECFQAGKNETGLDHYQVRTYPGWYRHITLSMVAYALLAVLRARANSPTTPPRPTPTTTT